MHLFDKVHLISVLIQLINTHPTDAKQK